MPTTTQRRPPLIVLGAGDTARQAFLLRRIAGLHPVLVLDPEPPAWVFPHAAGSWAIDLTNEVLVVAAVAEKMRSRGVAGVTTYVEQHVSLATQLAERFGLPLAGFGGRGDVPGREASAAERAPGASSLAVPAG